MAEVYPLDAVIRQVSGRGKINSHSQKIIDIDINTGKQKRSFFADIRSYLVSNSKGEQNYADRSGLVCNITSFDQEDLNFDLRISYRVSCIPGREVDVAETLWDNTHPGEELDRKIRNYVVSFFDFDNEISEIITNYKLLMRNLKDYLINRIRQEIGLDAKVKISLDKEDYLAPLKIISPHFKVQFSDYPEELDLQFEMELSVDEERKINAVFHSGDEDNIQFALQNKIKKYLSDHSNIEEFLGGFDSDLRKKLRSYLSDFVLSEYGRRISLFTLKSSDISTEIKEFFSVNHQVSCQIQEEKVTVKNTVQMTLENVGKYRMASYPDPESWVKENLDRVVGSILFDKTYMDMLSNFGPIQDEIRAEMINLSKSIGYKIKHIVSTPDGKHVELTKGFSFNVKDKFETKESNVKVGLDIIVDAQIQDLNKIENLLRSRPNVQDEMKQAVEREIRSFLHGIEPERFYMRYYSIDPSHTEEISVEKEIEQIIREKLAQEFYASVKRVIPKPVDTEIKEHFQQLQGDLGLFSIDVQSFEGDDFVCFKGKIQVEGVEANSWHKFQSRNCNMNAIVSYLEDDLRERLKTYSNKALEYVNPNDRNALIKLFNRWGQECIQEHFGLLVTIKGVGRSLTESEKIKAENKQKVKQAQLKQEANRQLAPFEINEQNSQLDKQILESVSAAKKSELEELFNQRKILQRSPGNEEEVKEIDKKIYSLTRETEEKAYVLLESVEEEASSSIEVSSKALSTETSFSEILEKEEQEPNGLFQTNRLLPNLEESE